MRAAHVMTASRAGTSQLIVESAHSGHHLRTRGGGWGAATCPYSAHTPLPDAPGFYRDSCERPPQPTLPHGNNTLSRRYGSRGRTGGRNWRAVRIDASSTLRKANDRGATGAKISAPISLFIRILSRISRLASFTPFYRRSMVIP